MTAGMTAKKHAATTIDDIPRVIDRLCEMYDESVANLRTALAHYLKNGERPDPGGRAEGRFAYPELRIDYPYGSPPNFPPRAYGRLNQPGHYATSVARPYLFRKYLTEQLRCLIQDYEVEVSVGRSASEIPYPYVLDGTDDLRLDGAQAADLAMWFPTTELAHIGDEIADGDWLQPPGRGRGRCRCSTARGSISAWRGCATIPAPRSSTPSATSCSPTMSAMSTSSSAGRSRSCEPRTAPMRASRRRAASTSPRTRPTRSPRSPRAAGAGTRCRPTI